MPDYSKNVKLTQLRETPNSVSGTITAPVQCGPDIPDDKVLYIWRIKFRNANEDYPRMVIIYAGDAANPARRELMRFIVDAGAGGLGHFTYPPYSPNSEAPIIRLAPDTTVTPTQENRIYIADDSATGGDIQNITYSYYHKREG